MSSVLQSIKILFSCGIPENGFASFYHSCSCSSSRKLIKPNSVLGGGNEREKTGARRSRRNEADAPNPAPFDPTLRFEDEHEDDLVADFGVSSVERYAALCRSGEFSPGTRYHLGWIPAMPSWIAEITHAEGGKISFERFMELALYDPNHGYYTRHIPDVGPSGDFATALTIGDALVRSIANWARAEARHLDFPKLNIIELGGGGGQLASGILRALHPWERVHYQIVEISGPLQKTQERTLRGRNVSWQKTIESALDAADSRAILISNEFVDAFPCRRFERAIEGWREITLRLDANLWREQLDSNSETVESSAFSIECTPGQRVETLGSYRRWLTNMTRLLDRGALLTIDYGDLPAEIYRRRPQGTARAFFRHQRLEGLEIYLRAGHQDLTADVNFLDLRNWGEALGLLTVDFVNQTEFIRRWYGARGKRGRNNAAYDYLSDEEAMGNAIKVLHQRKASIHGTVTTAM